MHRDVEPDHAGEGTERAAEYDYDWDTGEVPIGRPPEPEPTAPGLVPSIEQLPDAWRGESAEPTGADYTGPAPDPAGFSEPGADLRPGDPMPTYDTGQRRVEVGEDGSLPAYVTRERPVIGEDGSLPEFTDRDRYRSQPDEPELEEEPEDTGLRALFRRRR